ncbi:MAG: glycerophosphodiester phosphodiesterase family protein [Promethearchaeota archaeon]
MNARKSPLLVAHRGFSAKFPENTLLAFEQAALVGVDMVEFDVQATKDGHLVVLHDASVDRTTNGTGLVSELTLEEVKSLDAGRGQPVPTLKEVAAWSVNRTGLQAELKVRGFARTFLDDLEGGGDGVLERALVSSFDHAALRELKSLKPELAVATLEGQAPVRSERGVEKLARRFVKRALEVGAEAIHPHYFNAFPELVEAAHAAGLRVHVWTVNSPVLVKALLEMGVDGVISDDPVGVSFALKLGNQRRQT